MHRLGWVVVIGALAVTASVVAAGPAVAAKGGNSENAHACQQGGHENRFEAETGRPFKNAGDCTSHTAQGGATASVQIEIRTYLCPDSATKQCWGVISGSGLAVGQPWAVEGSGPFFVATGFPDANGNVASALNVACGQGSGPLQALAATGNPPTVIMSAQVTSPCR